jgi:hypothetical protein
MFVVAKLSVHYTSMYISDNCLVPTPELICDNSAKIQDDTRGQNSSDDNLKSLSILFILN